LKIEVQHLEDHQAKLTVEIESPQWEETKQRAARQLAKRTKIPGFRPGKAPFPVVQRLIGDDAISAEALEILVDEVYPKAIDEAKIEPYGPGALKDLKRDEPPTFEFVIPLKATVELGDYRSVRIPYELRTVSDDEVDNVVEGLREQQALVETIERPVEESDLVYVRISGQRKNVEEGQDPSIVKERYLPVNVSKEDDDTQAEWPFPGFSRRLIGMSAGDELKVDYTYPEDATFESLKGVDAEFEAKIDSVKSRTLPELNDEFAQSVGDFGNIEALRDQIRKNLEEQTRETYHEEYDNLLFEKIIESSTIKYPPQMLEHEIEHVIEHLENRLKQQKLDLELYLKSRQMDMDALRQEANPVAEKRIKRSLALYEIADELKVPVSPEDLQNETNRTLSEFARVMSEDEYKKLVTKDSYSSLVGNVLMDMILERTQERLRNMARGIEPETELTESIESSENVENASETPAEEVVEQEADQGNP
jgi:trigger factor